MKKIVFAVVVFAGTLVVTSGASATDKRTLAQFIRDCNTGAVACHSNLTDYLRAAVDQGFVCLPKGLSLNDAAGQELDWLRNQGDADDKLNQGSVEDAQWTAISTLWPCKTDDGASQ